ncbi:hypothetical protein IMSAGC007_04372 [Lachnospiraceae bacterium]|nr:hypothetical protein IMSAGC007_04372 [Lachnospiraceae bacterium]
MIKVLNETHNIVLAAQDIIPEALRGHKLIYFLDKRNMIVIAGWGRNTRMIGELIANYLEISPAARKMAGEYALSSGCECLMELDKVFKEIARLRNKQDNKVERINIDDIKIYPCFASSTPRSKKVERKEWQYSQSGMSEFDIVLDRNNYLIDGYIGYLIAKENGLTHIPVRYGRRQIIRAVHKTGGKAYTWEVPGMLINRVSVGDKVVVETTRGRRKVKVIAVEEYRQQDREPLRMVVRVKSRATA